VSVGVGRIRQTLRRAVSGARLLRRSALVLVGLAAVSASQGQKANLPPAGETTPAALEARWGVRLEGIRSSANGYVLDFRYRIVDPVKAQPLVDRRVTPHVTDEASGMRLSVPTFPTIGPLRQTTRDGMPEEGRIYFVLFANPGRLVQQGQRVTVEIGEFKAGLIVG